MTANSSPRGNRATVLIVDDDPQAIEILAEALGGDYEIRFAVTGAQTLQMIEQNEQANQPALILLDMLLPDTDGYTLYSRIKERAETADIPVIFVTSLRDTESEAKGLEMGAVDYITKPISPPIVRARVRNHIELARARADLMQSRDEALAAARAKASFLATVSHEIRTPLNGVIGMTGLLKDSKLDHDQLDYVNTIRVSGESLLALINDILDYSSIDSGRMVLESEPLRVRSLIEQAYETVADRAREKELELITQIGAGVPADIHGDALRLRQIIVNLVGNAVKFSERGEILTELRLAQPAADDELCRLEFRVSDTGIGIPPERLAMLFNPFTQLDSSTTRRYGGTGLGLAISKRLVELMGGEIGVDSTPGQGSTFHFTLPVRRAADTAQSLQQTSRVHLHGRRALVVEDNQRIRAFLWQQLEAWGVSAVAVESIQPALDALRQWERFDFAIIDSHQPDTGSEAIARAIQNEAAGATLPLIALSFVQSPEAAGQSPFRMTLLKPLGEAKLHDAIVKTLGGAEPLPAPGGAPGLNTPGFNTPGFNTHLAADFPLHILVVDDNVVNRKVAEATLIRLGYQPGLAEDGRQAVDRVAQAEAAGEPFDLVFMDVQMPLLDGLEATRIIKAAPDGLPPIIIAMTAAASVDDRSNCFYAGMDDYVSKPINFKEFQATIERWGGRMRHKRH